jgi:hypothetical protein
MAANYHSTNLVRLSITPFTSANHASASVRSRSRNMRRFQVLICGTT